MSEVMHRHGGHDWRSNRECPFCRIQDIQQTAETAEARAADAIDELRAENERLRNALRKALAYWADDADPRELQTEADALYRLAHGVGLHE